MANMHCDKNNVAQRFFERECYNTIFCDDRNITLKYFNNVQSHIIIENIYMLISYGAIYNN